MGTLLWFGCITILTVQYFYATGATWPEAIIKSIRDWVPWVVLTPFVFLLCNRFRIGRRRFFIHVPIHLVASICCVVIAELFE